MTITDEMVEKANIAFGKCVTEVDIAFGNHIIEGGMRAALEAVAPMLIAQGMREAAAIHNGSPYQMTWDEKIAAILTRAQAIEKGEK